MFVLLNFIIVVDGFFFISLIFFFFCRHVIVGILMDAIVFRVVDWQYFTRVSLFF